MGNLHEILRLRLCVMLCQESQHSRPELFGSNRNCATMSSPWNKPQLGVRRICSRQDERVSRKYVDVSITVNQQHRSFRRLQCFKRAYLLKIHPVLPFCICEGNLGGQEANRPADERFKAK